MPALNIYTLTISLINLSGENIAGVIVQVSLTESELIYPLGTPTETLFPTLQHSVTNNSGVVIFNLLPSTLVGTYKVEIGSYQRIIEMPANDVRFSELPEVLS